MIVPPEINSPSPGGILFCGRDPGRKEDELGRPFVGPAGAIFDAALGQAGILREEINITNVVGIRPKNNVFALHKRADVENGIHELHALIRRLRPNIVVAMGNEACFALIPGWPSKDGMIYRAYGIQDRRGFLWGNEDLGVKVLSTAHPASLLDRDDDSETSQEQRGINTAIAKMLLNYDFQKAKDEAGSPELIRPTREVITIDWSGDAAAAYLAICLAGYVTCDIEIRDERTLACVGFAVSSEKAYVFTERAFKTAFEILRDPHIRKCFHNGQFDMHFLLTRNGVKTEGFADDSIIGFHCAWPALAGKGAKGSKRTMKSLNFLSSIYTKDRYWKDYDFADDSEMYYLNGVDCMVTWDVMERVKEDMAAYNISEGIYRHELRLVWPVIHILARGILVDEQRRIDNVEALKKQKEIEQVRLGEVAERILSDNRERLSKPHLFWEERTCRCCGGGKKKSARCWSCRGFEKAPTKTMMRDHLVIASDLSNEEIKALSKTELEDLCLGPCEVCGGSPKQEVYTGFNPSSGDQVQGLLYEAIGIPKRYKKGRVTVEEGKLKDILGTLGG